MPKSCLRLVCLAIGALLIPPAAAELVITEIMCASLHTFDLSMDWWELTNTGPDAVNLQGYSWDDENPVPGRNVFGNITIAPGESIILLSDNGGTRIQNWKNAWRLPPQTQVYGYGAGQPLNGFPGLGGSDAVFLFSSSGWPPVASATYSNASRGSLAWHADGSFLGNSRAGWLGGYYSGNERPDIGSPGTAWSGTVNPLHEMLYWSDKDARKIQRRNPLTGAVEDVLTAADGLLDPRGIALDVPAQRLYWADMGRGAIYRSDLEGNGIEVLVDGLMAPADIEINLPAGFLYWADTDAGKIQRLNLRGGQVEDVLSGLVQPYYIEINLYDNALLWSYFNNTIAEMATLDGRDRRVAITGQQRVRDMLVRFGTVYWADRDAPAIRAGELWMPGMVIDYYGPESGLVRPHGMASHPLTTAIYWTDTAAGDIKAGSANVGDAPATVVASGLVGPWAVEIAVLDGDYNRDGWRNLRDFAVLARHWRQQQPGADLTGDGYVGVEDLALAFAPAWLKGPFD